MHQNKCLPAIFFMVLVMVAGLSAQQPNIIWLEHYGGPQWDGAYWVEEVSSADNRGETGFIMTGATESFGAGYYDIYLIKTDYCGIVEWEQVYGRDYHDVGYCVKPTNDGGFIVCGGVWDMDTYKSDGFLMKTDAYGDTIWTERYGGSGSETFFEVCQLSDGGYIAAGFVEEAIGYYTDIYLVRTDGNGQPLWSKEYGQAGFIEHAESIQPASDGGFVLCGWMNCIGTGYDVQFMKVNSDGNVVWTRYFGDDLYDNGYSVARTADGGYIIAGHKTVTDRNYNSQFYLIKTDNDGFVEWEQTYGGAGDDLACSVRQTTDGGYIITGFSESFNHGGNDIYVVKTDAGGNLEWHDIFGDDSHEIGECIRPISDGNFVVTGHAETFGGARRDAFLMKFSPGQLGVENEIGDLTPGKVSLSRNYPNPFNSQTVIEFYLSGSSVVSVEVFNLLGEKVEILLNEPLSSGNHYIRWDGSDKSSGIYIYRIVSGEGAVSGKMSHLK